MGFKGTALAFCVLIGGVGFGATADAARPDRQHQPGNTPVARPARGAATKPVTARTAAAPAHQARTGSVTLRLHGISPARAAAAGKPRPRLAASAGRRGAAVAGISCVPYARQVTGMQISGNGWQWWGNAAGNYARGRQPEPGSVLAFRSTARMRYGHVAVVRDVLGPRHLLIDHANWAGPGMRRGQVMQGVHVIDVSDTNDWSDVRVQIGRNTEAYGRNYPTYGFIYNRPDTGRWLAEGEQRQAASFEEVAEAEEPVPAHAPRAGQRSSRSHRRTARH